MALADRWAAARRLEASTVGVRRKETEKRQHFVPQKCPHCDYFTDDRFRFERHLTIHSDERPFSCTYDGCEFKSKHESSLANHIKFVHQKVKPYECHVCGHKCSMKSSLRTHMRSHLSTHDPDSCLQCHQALGWTLDHLKQTKTTLLSYRSQKKKKSSKERVYLQSGIPGSKIFSCPYDGCQYQTYHRQARNSHIKWIHLKIRSYHCNVCTCP